MTHCQGRVFTRLQQYEALSAEAKEEIESLERHLTLIKAQLFDKHHPKLLKSTIGVKYKDLLDKTDEYLRSDSSRTLEAHTTGKVTNDHQTPPSAVLHDAKASGPSGSGDGGSATRGFGGAGVTAEPTEQDKASLAAAEGKDQVDDKPVHYGTMGIAGAPAPLALPSKDADVAAPALPGSDHAKRLVEGLVLKGFITPYKEDDKLVDLNARESFEFADSDLLVPVASALVDVADAKTTVWDVAPGAIYANMIKRKANLLEKIKYGKDVYAVVDANSNTLTLFDDDVSREPIAQIKAVDTQMGADIAAFEHGVKVWNHHESEVFDPASVLERDIFVAALHEIGIKAEAGKLADVGADIELTPGKGMPNVMDKMKHDHHATDNHHAHGQGAPSVNELMKSGHPTNVHGHGTASVNDLMKTTADSHRTHGDGAPSVNDMMKSDAAKAPTY